MFRLSLTESIKTGNTLKGMDFRVQLTKTQRQNSSPKFPHPFLHRKNILRINQAEFFLLLGKVLVCNFESLQTQR